VDDGARGGLYREIAIGDDVDRLAILHDIDGEESIS